jgi:hypothetical protein
VFSRLLVSASLDSVPADALELEADTVNASLGPVAALSEAAGFAQLVLVWLDRLDPSMDQTTPTATISASIAPNATHHRQPLVIVARFQSNPGEPTSNLCSAAKALLPLGRLSRLQRNLNLASAALRGLNVSYDAVGGNVYCVLTCVRLAG